MPFPFAMAAQIAMPFMQKMLEGQQQTTPVAGPMPGQSQNMAGPGGAASANMGEMFRGGGYQPVGATTGGNMMPPPQIMPPQQIAPPQSQPPPGIGATGPMAPPGSAAGRYGNSAGKMMDTNMRPPGQQRSTLPPDPSRPSNGRVSAGERYQRGPKNPPANPTGATGSEAGAQHPQVAPPAESSAGTPLDPMVSGAGPTGSFVGPGSSGPFAAGGQQGSYIQGGPDIAPVPGSVSGTPPAIMPPTEAMPPGVMGGSGGMGLNDFMQGGGAAMLGSLGGAAIGAMQDQNKPVMPRPGPMPGRGMQMGGSMGDYAKLMQLYGGRSRRY